MQPPAPRAGKGVDLKLQEQVHISSNQRQARRVPRKTLNLLNSLEMVRAESKPPFSALAAWLGTAVVGVRVVPLVLHSAAHVQLGIFLPSVLANGYIVAVLFVGPVLAAGLLWTSAARGGAWLLLGSMLGSLLFELYNHYLVMSPDHVSQVPHGGWGQVFEATAAATIVLEGLGCAVAIYLLMGPLNSTCPVPSLKGGSDS
jgi:hypothetical protein